MLNGSNGTGLADLLDKALESELGDMDSLPFEQMKLFLDIKNVRSIWNIQSKFNKV